MTGFKCRCNVLIPNVSLGNKNKFITFNIFSCRNLIILYKVLIITRILIEKANELTINDILCQNVTIFYGKNSFLMLIIGKNESVQEFKAKIFEKLFYCRLQSCKSCMAACSGFQQTWYFTFWDNFYLFKNYPVKLPQNCLNSFNYSNQSCIQVSKFLFVLDKELKCFTVFLNCRNEAVM